MGGVTITELIDKMGLRNMTPELETDNVMLVHADGIAADWIFRPF